MGESPALLVRSNSLPSPTSSEENKGNYMKRALTSSISFGRFVGESLDWERFSAFNQNRYLEEVERYSKPGSVAEKKAYFEAHYKRKRAAALLEQQNVEPNNVDQTNVASKVEDNSCLDSKSEMGEVNLVSENTMLEEVSSCDAVVSVSCEAEIARELGGGLSEGDDQANEPMLVDESPRQLTNHLENDECVVHVSNEESMKYEDASSAPSNVETPEVSSSNFSHRASLTKQVPLPPVPPPIKAIMPIMPGLLVNKEKAPLNNRNIAKDYGNKITRTPTKLSEQKPQPQVSSSKLLRNISSAMQVPTAVKPVTPGRLLNKEKMTLNSRNYEGGISNKKTRSTPTSLHMSINLPPRFVETQKAIPPVLPPKNVNPRLVKAPLKKPNNNSLSQILTRTSANGTSNTSSVNRTVRQHVNSLEVSRISDGKLSSLSTSYAKTSNTSASNGRSQAVSASFTFRSEERVAKRKEFFEKLDQKLKSNEPNKQSHAKPQVKARNDLKDHLKASKTNEIPHRVDSSSNITKKSLNAMSLSPKLKHSAPFRVQDIDSRPPWRFSTKMDSLKEVTGKNYRPPISSSAKSFSMKSMCENSSPNIQV